MHLQVRLPHLVSDNDDGGLLLLLQVVNQGPQTHHQIKVGLAFRIPGAVTMVQGKQRQGQQLTSQACMCGTSTTMLCRGV